MRARPLLASLVATALAAPSASAYCRTTTCDPTAQSCAPDRVTGCVTAGKPLYWPTGCAGYSLQKDASKRVSLDTATAVADVAFHAWTKVACPGDGRAPAIVLDDLGPVACDQHEYNQDQGNANVIVFRDDTWPYTGSANTLALTTVTYNVDTGEIYDADMEVNGTVPLTTGAPVVYDLQSILTHESGHFIGLAHSTHAEATMYPRYDEGTTSLRTLEADDIAGVCAIYPPPANPSCDPTPRHGFSSTCATAVTPTTKGCCATAPGAPAHGAGATVAALGALATLVRRRRRAAP